jgi:hypothetical protein
VKQLLFLDQINQKHEFERNIGEFLHRDDGNESGSKTSQNNLALSDSKRSKSNSSIGKCVKKLMRSEEEIPGKKRELSRIFLLESLSINSVTKLNKKSSFLT